MVLPGFLQLLWPIPGIGPVAPLLLRGLCSILSEHACTVSISVKRQAGRQAGRVEQYTAGHSREKRSPFVHPSGTCIQEDQLFDQQRRGEYYRLYIK